MKAWLTQFRISNAFDDRRPLPPAVEHAVAQSAELRRFAETTARLDGALKKNRPAPETVPALHAAIMRAVRSAEPAPDGGWAAFRPRLMPAAALALLVGLGLFGFSHFSSPPGAVSQNAGQFSLAAASSALEMGSQLVHAVPAAAMSPLNEERLGLDRDLANAQNFLLASLP